MLACAASADPPGPGRRGPAIYGDWRLDCRAAPCTAYMPLLGTDGSEVLRLALPRGGAALTVGTALPVFVPDGVVLSIGARPIRTTPWRTCGPDGCEAWFALDPELLNSLRNERGGSVTLSLADGTPVRLTVSLRGSAAALRARDGVRPAG
ncbi:MAG: invasion associated locus B family protein [Amaricoccus sp.]|uniref:invasion associated locus B family protein n=1 Tax=Amaricoccus sp. TaxID=1872485 RepID=UPI0039E307CB